MELKSIETIVGNEILSLPISYYFKTDCKVETNTSNDSYFMLDKNIISLSISSICNVCSSQSITIEQVNTITRPLLYHELSHVILTPRTIFVRRNEEERDIINIFEDERIETLLQKFYIKVDFKDFVKQFNGWNKIMEMTPPTCPRELFFRIVRFRSGDKLLTDLVQNLIKEFRSLNSRSDICYTEQYTNGILNLFAMISDEFYKDKVKRELEEEKEKQKKYKQGNGDIQDNEEQPDIDNVEEQEEEDEDTNEFDNILTEEEFEEISEFIKKALSDTFKKAVVDKDIYDTFSIAFKQNKKFGNKSIADISKSYSGRINPRNIGKPNENYKWFDNKSGDHNFGRTNKIKLNLWLDQSGSFSSNDRPMNKILSALEQLEIDYKFFEFDMIRMENKVELMPKDKRVSKSSCGNCLDDNIHKVWTQVQDLDATNYNLVLFDGDANSDASYGGGRLHCEQNFKAFNHDNCVIISDLENDTPIKKYCKQAKVVICGDYLNEFKKAIVNTMKSMLN